MTTADEIEMEMKVACAKLGLTAKDLAKALNSVQPMTNPTGDIFSLRTVLKSPWTGWAKTFSFLPRCSINGKFVVGWICKQERFVTSQITNNNGEIIPKSMPTEYRWATRKEVFLDNLKGDA